MHRRSKYPSFTLLSLLSVAAFPFPAWAQAPAALIAPRLIAPAAPVYPESERAGGKSATVVLSLTIGTDGSVTASSVVQSGGETFDQAALEASLTLRFSPASRGGVPIAARIPFTFEFSAPIPVALPTDAGLPPAIDGGASATETDPSPAQELEVVGDRTPTEVTRYVLTEAEIKQIPGTNGDALRAIESMPGVAWPPGNQGLLLVRGSGPNDTGIFVDGTQIPIAYHFGGVSSILPTELVSQLDFFPGNFGPEYGRLMGGVVDAHLRSPASDGFHAMLQVDSLDVSAIAEGPLGPHTRVLAAARRSWVDLWIGGLLSAGGDTRVVTAPVYYDYQAMVEQDIGSRTKARLTLFGSSDSLNLVLGAPSESDAEFSGPLTQATSFFRIQARTDSLIGDSARWSNTLSFGLDHPKNSLSTNLSIDGKIWPLDFRSELRLRLSDWVNLVLGVDLARQKADATIQTPWNTNYFGPLFGQPAPYLHGHGLIFQPAEYALVDLDPIPALKLLASLRVDYSSDIDKWVVSPRFAARYDLHPGYRRTTLKLAVGVYDQPPQIQESNPTFGSPELGFNRSVQYSAGIEQQVTSQIDVSLEGFYKNLTQLVALTPDATAGALGATYANSGSGRAYGGELLVRYQADAHFFGWLSYTLAKSERRLTSGAPLALYDFDETHNLTAVASYRFSPGWQIGLRFRYATGTPYTPAVAAVYDSDAGSFAPLNGSLNSARLGPSHELDLRVEKRWAFTGWSLTAFIDIEDVYLHGNPGGIQYNYNYTRAQATTGLPILPIIGLRGEL
jgi:TonB family protein